MHTDFAPGLWWGLLAVLAVGSTVIVGLVAVACRFVRSAAWQRTLWQAGTLGLLALVLFELSGTRAGLIRLCRESERPSAITLAEATAFQDAEFDAESGASPTAPGASIPPPQFGAGLPTPPTRSVETPGPSINAPSLEVAGSVTGTPLSESSPSDHWNWPDRAAQDERGLAGSLSAATETGAAPQSLASSAPVPDNRSRQIGSASTASTEAVSQPAIWWPAALWGIGAAVVLTRILWGRAALWVFRGRLTQPCDEAISTCVRRLARRMGIRRQVRVLVADRLGAPIVFGGLRPAIVVPAAFAHDFDSQQQRAMLAHELAHLASGDPAWHAVAMLACSVLWWQPLVWWSRRKLRAAGEAAADEASLLVPDGPHVLASSLVLLARRLIDSRPVAWLSVEGGGFRSGLGLRVERLLGLRARSWRRPGGRRLTMARSTLPAALALTAILCTAWAPAQAPYPEGGTTMSVLSSSWRTSLAATALWALLGPAPSDTLAQDTPAEKEKPAAEKREQPDREKPAAKRDGEGERREGERREGERREMDAHAREIMQKRQQLEEQIQALKARARETKEGSDDRKELEARLEKMANQLREMRVPDRPRPEGADRERIMRRLEQIREQVQELKKAGKMDAAERLVREGRELMQALGDRGPEGDRPDRPRPEGADRERIQRRLAQIREQVQDLEKAGRLDAAEQLKREAQELMRALGDRGPERDRPGRPRPEGPEDRRARIERLRIAAANLREAGFEGEAQHVMELAERLAGGGEGRPDREGPRPDQMGPPEVRELRGEVQQMRREMQELREQLKRLLDRDRK